jgi:hypothetical protein
VCTKVICTQSGLSHISSCRIRDSSYAISTKFNIDCARSIHVCGREGCNALGTWALIWSREKDRSMIQETLVSTFECLLSMHCQLHFAIGDNSNWLIWTRYFFTIVPHWLKLIECGPAGVAENIWITVAIQFSDNPYIMISVYCRNKHLTLHLTARAGRRRRASDCFVSAENSYFRFGNSTWDWSCDSDTPVKPIKPCFLLPRVVWSKIRVRVRGSGTRWQEHRHRAKRRISVGGGGGASESRLWFAGEGWCQRG